MVRRLKNFFCILLLGISMTALAERHSIWFMGDSISNNSRVNITGVLQESCRPEIKVENCVVKGANAKSFREQGYWEIMLKSMKSGDFLLIHFNYAKQSSSKPNVSETETACRDNLLSYIREARAAGVKPVLITPMYVPVFKNGRPVHTPDAYSEECRRVADEQQVSLLDLNKISFSRIEAMGEKKSKKIYDPADNNNSADLNPIGIKMIAKWLIADAKNQMLELAELFY